MKDLALGVSFLCIFFTWRLELLQAGQNQQDLEFSLSACPWTEAQMLFHGDPHWLGGDGASSVDLDMKRVLWLFGDSFVNEGDSRSRYNAVLVRNSIAVQSGRDPAKARMRFFWNKRKGKPTAYFQEEGDEWFWPGSGAPLKRALIIIFLMKIRESRGGLGFEPSGWKAVLIADTGKDASMWHIKYLSCPPTQRILVGSSSTLILDSFLYAFCTDWKDNFVYLVRWPLGDACRGDLSHLQWWMGTNGWMEGKPLEPKPVPVFTGGQVEFTVHYEPRIKRFLQIQTFSLNDPCLSMRFSQDLTGPWTLPICFFQPPEKRLPGLLIYAGKAHKVFNGADLAFTYSVNTMDKKKILKEKVIYYPVVLKGKVSMKRRGP